MTAYEKISSLSQTTEDIRFVCTNCFVKNGGHLFESKGQGIKVEQCKIEKNHKNDTSFALKEFTNWITVIAESEDEEAKDTLLQALTPLLKLFEKSNAKTTISEETPSLFLVKVAMRLGKITESKNESAIKLLPGTCADFGKNIGLSL